MVRRDLFHALGGFDAAPPPSRTGTSRSAWPSAGRSPSSTSRWCTSASRANSITRDVAAKLAGRIRLVERNRAAFARHPALLARQYRYIANSCFWERRDPAAARAWLGRALRADPRPASLAHALRLAPALRAGRAAALRPGRSRRPASSASK